MRRRDFALGLMAGGASAREQAFSAAMPDMLLSWLAKQLNEQAERWEKVRAAIRTPEQIEERNRYVRAKMREMIHGLPERTALRPEVTGRFARQGYRVENILFQSRPDFWVTGNLYIPTGRSGPFPGIISPCGHYPNGKAYPDYQAAYVNLVRSGFVVLGYDPIGQGERRQYWNPETGRVDVGGPTTEHSMAGQLLLLVGEDLTHYRIWDGMRAIDYLQTRPEVDGSRIGCAGHSGGGTLTMFISALDERVKAAVINEGGTGHRWPMELRPEARIGPSDVEQNLFPAAMLGVDLCDIHTAIAPRPLLALIEDYNPRFNLAAEHLKNRYTQLGVAEKFATAEASDPHAWTPKLRIATTNFFRKWFLDAVPLESEAEFTPEEERKLYATPNGSILHSGTGETIYTLLRKKPLPSKACSAEDVARVLGYKRPAGGPESREIVRTPRQRYTIEKVEILSEPGIYLPVWVFWPAWHFREAPRAVVYVHEAGKEADGMEYGRLEKMAQQGQVVVAVDVRGIGATRPPHAAPGERPDEFGHLFNVETAMSYMAWYLDRSLFTMRVEDVVRTVDYATSRFDRAGVTMIGRGMGALWALYAAALDDRVKAVRCERMLKSYRTLIESDRYLHGANVFLRDVLLHFDIPQVAALVGGRLTIDEPVDAMKRYNA